MKKPYAGFSGECSLEYSGTEHSDSYVRYGERASVQEYILDVPQAETVFLTQSESRSLR